jgi:IS5 family transposase
VPRQRNSRDENAQIKAGQPPENWKQQLNKLRQKDIDARWLKKNNIKVDKGTKLINNWMVTPACDHDAQELETLLEKQDAGQPLYADSAYVGKEEIIDECDMSNEVHEKGTKKARRTTHCPKSKKPRIG